MPNFFSCANDVVREFRMRNFTMHDKKPQAVLDDRIAFVLLVSNLAVMTKCDPTASRNRFDPIGIFCRLVEQVVMADDIKAIRPEDLREMSP
jgi:hypothetical protein